MNDNMVYEFDATDGDVYSYGYGINNANGDIAYLKNAHGDIVQLVENDSISKNYQYDAFGNEIGLSENDSNPYRYAGEYYDTETGTIYLRARYYSPVNGRFTTKDPHWNVNNMIYGDPLEDNPNVRMPDYLAIRQSANLYVYCLNDPLRFKDSSGDVEASAVLTGGWGIGGSTALVDGPLPFGDALGIIIGIGGTIISGGIVIGSWWENLINEKEAEIEKEETVVSEKTTNPVVFPADPNSFVPVGLTKNVNSGTKNGMIIYWNNSLNETVFRWDENTNYSNGAHYHITSSPENVHYYAGDIVPEPYASIYFPQR